MKDSNSQLEWDPISRKTVYSNRIFDIYELLSRSPDDTTSTFFSLHASDWVIVVPVLKDDKGRLFFVLVKQWRHGASGMSVEFPGGVIDPGEDPTEAAKRELREETGYRGVITHAATFSPNPAIMDNRCHIYIAEDLEDTKVRDLDDDEYVDALILPAQEVIRQMGHGEFMHGLMCSALFLYIQKKGLPE